MLDYHFSTQIRMILSLFRIETNDTSMGLRFDNISLPIHSRVDLQSSGRSIHLCYNLSPRHENRPHGSHRRASGSSYTRRVQNGGLVDAFTGTERTPVC
jgi:hypothetical protein